MNERCISNFQAVSHLRDLLAKLKRRYAKRPLVLASCTSMCTLLQFEMFTIFCCARWGLFYSGAWSNSFHLVTRCLNFSALYHLRKATIEKSSMKRTVLNKVQEDTMIIARAAQVQATFKLELNERLSLTTRQASQFRSKILETTWGIPTMLLL